MLEKKLTLDCNFLGEQDPLNIVSPDHPRKKVFYASLIDAFILYYIKREIPNIKVSILSGSKKSSMIMNAKDFEVICSGGEDGIENISILYKENYSYIAERAENLTEIFYSLQENKFEKCDNISEESKRNFEFHSDYYSLCLSTSDNSRFVTFKKKKDEKYIYLRLKN